MSARCNHTRHMHTYYLVSSNKMYIIAVTAVIYHAAAIHIQLSYFDKPAPCLIARPTKDMYAFDIMRLHISLNGWSRAQSPAPIKFSTRY